MIKTGRNDPCRCGSGKKYKQCCQQRSEASADSGSVRQVHERESLLRRAMEHQRAGRMSAAVSLLTQILQLEPDQPDALHLLGVSAHQLGQTDMAADLIGRAVKAAPHNFLFCCNYGNVLYALGQRDAAGLAFRQALALRPDYAPAHYDLGVVLQDQGQVASAIEHYRCALKFRPDHADTYRNLGALLQQQGQVEAAIDCFRQAIALKPDYAEAHFHLASALNEYGDTNGAVQFYLKAIACKSDFPEAHYNLGVVLDDQGKLGDAMVAFQLALASRPNYAEPHFGIGRVLRAQGNAVGALDSFRRALSLKPDFSNAYNDLAGLLKVRLELDEALSCYRSALSIKPNDAKTYSNFLLSLQYSSNVSPTDVFAEHLRFAELFEAPLKAGWPAHANSRDKDRRLRVGYVSGDFRNHAVAYFFEPILASHDKSRIETFCYSNHHYRDGVTDRLMAAADHWVSCERMSDQQLAERIRYDGIDILVDLSGHTAHNRLKVFARKPAPIQVTWIGYAGTTGLSAMDYRLTDAYMDPPGLTEHLHSEQLIRLSGAGAAYRPEPGCPPVTTLPALTTGMLTLASLNSLAKINQQVVNLWGRIMRAIPHSRLVLANVGDAAIRQRLVSMFHQAGVAEERLVLVPNLSILEYLALHGQIDLGLDPFPYPGGTTTSHSLWMGVPVISLAGEHMVARCGVTALSRIGLDQFVTYSEEDYLRRAIEIAEDLPALDRVRQSLRSRMTGANCDPAIITANLEAAYRQMWMSWCEVPVSATAG